MLTYMTSAEFFASLEPLKATDEWIQKNTCQKREQMLRELQSDLCDLVCSGDITDVQANEWYNRKADQWVNGVD